MDAVAAQCLGDERVTETDYVAPSATGGRWMIRTVSETRMFGRDGDARVAQGSLDHLKRYIETLFGLPAGG